ncbi:MAG TPA: class I SAM-dependent methyltransferase [Bryobacteraceae bacterium]|nr:class I SAM-dependent methyltransferase [Bryobacteraceae bacterium]
MATATQFETEQTAARRDAFIERLFQSALGAFDIFTIHLGDRLGFYEVLSADGPLTSAELAARTGTHERYAREWLEQQAMAGILDVKETTGGNGARRFCLPSGHEEVLAQRDSLNYLAPLAQIVAGAVRPIDALLTAFRTGGGVPFAAYGADVREGQARINRAAFLYQLGKEWLPAIPDVHSRMLGVSPPRVADVGCGAGWSSIGIALHYPNVRVDGFDLDGPSIELARANAGQYAIGERVRFFVRDAGDPGLAGQYDLVTAFECIHDMSNPVGALRAMRRLAKDDGTVLVVDERVGEEFQPGASVVERLMYGFSVLHCLPSGMADQPSAATGAAMRPSTLRRYAMEAGFRDVEILPIDNFLFRFYRLLP